MKKTTYLMLPLMVGAMALTACSSDGILEDNLDNSEMGQNIQLKQMTFTAFQECHEATRAAIDGLKINWSEGDKITIFDGSDGLGGGKEFTLESGAGTTSATFSGEAAPEPNPDKESVNGFYYALYPYAAGPSSTNRIPTLEDAVAAAGSKEKLDYYFSWGIHEDGSFHDYIPREEMTTDGIGEDDQNVVIAYFMKSEAYFHTPGVYFNGGICDAVLPSEQKATAGSADPKAMIMIAKSDSVNNLQFKNVCAYVKVTPQFNCYAIRLTSKGNESLTGMMSVNYNDGNPKIRVWEGDGSNTVTLVGNMTAGTDYYIAVLPGTLASGFNIEFLSLTQNLYRARSTDKPLELTRSHVMNLGKFDVAHYPWTIESYLSGNDGDNYWMLVTPTLKISLPAPGQEFDEPCPFEEVPTPDEGWELPSLYDLEAVCKEGIFTYDEYMNVTTIQATGFLRYGNPTSRWGKLEGLWTSTGAEGYNHQSVVNPYSGEVIHSEKNKPNSYLFKYVR